MGGRASHIPVTLVLETPFLSILQPPTPLLTGIVVNISVLSSLLGIYHIFPEHCAPLLLTLSPIPFFFTHGRPIYGVFSHRHNFGNLDFSLPDQKAKQSKYYLKGLFTLKFPYDKSQNDIPVWLILHWPDWLDYQAPWFDARIFK